MRLLCPHLWDNTMAYTGRDLIWNLNFWICHINGFQIDLLLIKSKGFNRHLTFLLYLAVSIRHFNMGGEPHYTKVFQALTKVQLAKALYQIFCYCGIINARWMDSYICSTSIIVIKQQCEQQGDYSYYHRANSKQ